MRRRIIKQGNNSFTLTMPISWVREHGLKGGDEVNISEEDGGIIINLPKDVRKLETSITIDIKDYNERTIRNILNQIYRKGYDKIILKYNRPDQLDDIKEVVKTLLGFAVHWEEENTCIVENIAEPSGEKFKIILRKLFFIIKGEAKEILDEFKEGTAANISKRKEIKDMVDKYTNFCRRIIIKDKIGGTKNSYSLMVLVTRLSLIYHAYFYLYQLSIWYKFASTKRKFKLSKELMDIFGQVNESFDLLHEAFYEKNLEKAHNIGVIKDQLFDKIYRLFQKTKGFENVILYRLGEVLRLTHMNSTLLFGLGDLDLDVISFKS